MGKGDTRGKHKPLPKGIPGLAPIKAKGKQPRERGRFVAAPPEDARITALAARCHHVGKTPDKEGRASVTAPWMGEPIGMCMAYDNKQEVCARLWTVWMGLCAAERAYRVRILGVTGEPQNSALPMLPEKMEADTGHTVDIRTAAQKDDDAVAAYMRWRGYLGQIDKPQASRLLDITAGQGGELWRDQAPTSRGYQALAAVTALADVVDRDSTRTRR